MSAVPVPFQNGEASAVAIVVVFATLSLVALDFFWLRVLYIAFQQFRTRGAVQPSLCREKHIFHSHLGAYTFSLLMSNLLSAISFVLNVAYVAVGHISSGPLCRSQATLSQVADVATAYFTGAIAVHTFNSLVLHRRLPIWFGGVVVAFGWVASIVMATVPAHFETKHGPFYTIDGALCGISPEYGVWQTYIHLLPIFLASLVAVLFYSLVFLTIRGTLTFRDGLKFNLDPESRRSTVYLNFESPQFIASISRGMLWYPTVYVALMFPHLIACFVSASGAKVSFDARIFTSACQALLGLANVLVFYNIIRIMGPAFQSPAPSEQSFGASISKEKSGSPVDVAPPVAAFVRPGKAFPPPRSASVASSNDSTRALLASRYRTAYAGSVVSSDAASIGRPITPAADPNQMIATPAPVATKDKQLFHLSVAIPEEDATSLPAPKRTARSHVVSQSLDQAMLTAVPLKTPAGAAFPQNGGSQRDSFINMYASRSPVPEPESSSSTEPKMRLAPPALVLNDGEAAAVPSSGSASGYSSSSASDAPASAFVDKQQLSAARPSFRSAVRDRMSTIDVPEGGLSPLAFASIVTDAATSNGGVRAPADLKAARRRSRSLDNLAVPAMLRPRVPASATLRRNFAAMDALAPPMSAGLPVRSPNRLARWDSKAVVRPGPERTATFSTTSSDSP